MSAMTQLLNRVVDRWARREPAMVVSVASLVIVLGLLLVSLATLRNNDTAFGPALAADFPTFYNAGRMIQDGHASDLYDLKLQNDYYHRLLPEEPANSSLPFFYPPFVAVPFILLSMLSYKVAALIWMGILLALYATGVQILLSITSSLTTSQKRLGLLLAVAFPPFLVESLLSGQMPPVAFLALSLAIFLADRDRLFLCGLALAICSYKPTLLVLLLPLLLIGRQWRILQGFVTGYAALCLFSIAVVGLNTFIAYVKLLLGVMSMTKEGFRTFKFVDLASFIRNLTLSKSGLPSQIGLVGVLVALIGLARPWLKFSTCSVKHRKLILSHTLTWTLILNVYTAIYDVTLLVIPLLCFLDERDRYRNPHDPSDLNEDFPRRLRLEYLVLYAACWLTQPITILTRVQLLTLVLGWIAVGQSKKGNEVFSVRFSE